MRADRLLSILLLLQNRGKITTKDLAGILESSERTILRDMEALSAAGIPVYSERGRQGGWMLTEGYRTSLTGMKPKEIGALLISADPSILKDLDFQGDFTQATRKLEAASSPESKTAARDFSRRILVDGEGWHPSGESFPYLPVLQEALWNECKVNLSYHRGHETSERTIGVLGLVVKRGVWYIVADHAGELRTYRVSRVIRATLLDEAYTRPIDFDLTDYWESSKAAFKSSLPRYGARLIVHNSVLKELGKERYVTLHAINESSSPGWTEAETEFNTIESACRIILSYGPALVVASPAELRDRVKAALGDTISLYEQFPSGS